jgi:hypothetical protein
LVPTAQLPQAFSYCCLYALVQVALFGVFSCTLVQWITRWARQFPRWVGLHAYRAEKVELILEDRSGQMCK